MDEFVLVLTKAKYIEIISYHLFHCYISAIVIKSHLRPPNIGPYSVYQYYPYLFLWPYSYLSYIMYFNFTPLGVSLVSDCCW